MRLLLAEDDAELVESLTKVLQKAGYSIDVATDGIEADYLGQENLYDVVILDLGLPKKNGLQVLKHWRGCNNKTPVLILTARDHWHERVEGFQAGADDYLGKPFHIQELLVRLNAILQRVNKEAPSDVLTVGVFCLSHSKQTLTVNDCTTHELTATEYKLMRYFLLHPNQILSKGILLDRVYNMDSDKDSNVIEVYIKRIRKIVGKECIETKRGQGYLFKIAYD